MERGYLCSWHYMWVNLVNNTLHTKHAFIVRDEKCVFRNLYISIKKKAVVIQCYYYTHIGDQCLYSPKCYYFHGDVIVYWSYHQDHSGSLISMLMVYEKLHQKVGRIEVLITVFCSHVNIHKPVLKYFIYSFRKRSNFHNCIFLGVYNVLMMGINPIMQILLAFVSDYTLFQLSLAVTSVCVWWYLH